MILITGGMGFLGVNLAKYLMELGEEVLLTSHRNLQVPEMLTEYVGTRLKIASMDVTCLTTVLDSMKKYKIASVIHAAGTSGKRGESLYQIVDANVIGSANVLEAARLMDVGRITFISSEGVNQGRKNAAPLKEEEFFWARSDRSIPATKKMTELLFLMYQKEYRLDIVITRPSRIYGPFYFSGRTPIIRLVTAAVKKLNEDFSSLNENESHDFIYVRDCARAVAMIHMAKRPGYDLYNIGSGRSHSVGDVARALEDIVPGTTFRLGSGQFYTASKTEYDILTYLDISRIREEFGYIPEYDLRKGLSALIAWVKDGRYL